MLPYAPPQACTYQRLSVICPLNSLRTHPRIRNTKKRRTNFSACLRHESGPQQKSFMKTCSNELYILGGSFRRARACVRARVCVCVCVCVLCVCVFLRLIIQVAAKVRSFVKGLGGRGGWHEEILPMPEIQASFLCPLFHVTLKRRGHNSGDQFLIINDAFWALLATNPIPPTTFSKPLRKPAFGVRYIPLG